MARIERVSYRTRFVERLGDAGPLPATTSEAAELPKDVLVPFLLANAEALECGSNRIDCSIDGRPGGQRPFPYQGKCLKLLREGRAALAPDARCSVDALLAGTGCERLFIA